MFLKKRKVILMVIAAAFALLLLTAVLLPSIINIDSFRPQIVDKVNQNISGKVSIEKLSLSVLTGLKVNITGLKLNSGEGEEVLSLEHAAAKSSFWAAVFGRPYVSLALDKPNLQIKRSEKGEIDLLKAIVKNGASAKPVEEPPVVDSPASDKEWPWYLALFVNAKVNLILTEANLTVSDQITDSKQEFKNLDLSLLNLGLNQPVTLDLSGELVAKVQDKLNLSGLFRVYGQLEATSDAEGIQSVRFQVTKDLSDFSISYGNVFKKDKSVPLKFDLRGIHIGSDLNIEDVSVQLNETVLQGAGTVKNFDQQNGVVDLNILSNEINLESWHKLLPAVRNIAGEGDLAIRVSQQIRKPVVNVDINMQKASIELQGKAKPFDLSGQVAIEKSDLISVDAQLNMFSGEVNVLTKLDISRKSPRYNITAKASGLDVKNATEVFLTDFSNSLTGRLSMTASGSGSGLATKELIKNMLLEGSFTLEDATFKTFDLLSVANKAIKDATQGASDYFPELQAKLNKKVANARGEYQTINSSFRLENAKISMPDFTAKAKPSKGLDFEGDTKIGLVDKKILAQWEIIDTYDKLDLQKVDISYKGHKIDKALAEKDGFIHVPITVECEFTKPCFKYERTIKYFRRKVEDSLKKKVKTVLGEKAAKEINKQREKIKKKAKEEVQNLLKKIGF